MSATQHEVGKQAVKDETQIDAALMNVNLRGEMSFPIADALAERGVPFLFVTGNDKFVSVVFCIVLLAIFWRVLPWVLKE